VVVDSTGAVVNRQLYRAFGAPRYTSGTDLTDYGYTGQRADDSIGLMYYNARWYDPALGRFTQADTIIPGAGNPIAWDRYAYVVNNPMMYLDPSGNIIEVPGFVLGGALGGMVAAITYFCTNLRTFDSGEYWTAVVTGAVTGAMIGSGLEIAGAALNTMETAVANFLIGGGSSGLVTGEIYMASNPDEFEPLPYVEVSYISTVAGGVNAILPKTPVGWLINLAVNITSSELQYCSLSDNVTGEGIAINGALGVLGTSLDFTTSMIIDNVIDYTGSASSLSFYGWSSADITLPTGTNSLPILVSAAMRTRVAGLQGILNSGNIISSSVISASVNKYVNEVN